MAKLSSLHQNSNFNNTTTSTTTTRSNIVVNGGVNPVAMKPKRTRKTIPRDSPPQRSSIYRGVTRHRWTGRYEAHLWDKNCWNEAQNKKGRQVYLGAYDDEAAAARAYDLAALKYWGRETILNFPVSTYEKEIIEMEAQSREEFIGSLRRKSSGFSRGVSKYRGVARHHHNGRWEARIGRVFGNKYLYLGTYATQEEAAIAYDMAAIEYRGLNAVTNFDLSRYIKWLKPNSTTTTAAAAADAKPNNIDIVNIASCSAVHHNSAPLPPLQQPSEAAALCGPRPTTTAKSALGLLLQSSKFKQLMEMNMAAECPSTPPTENAIPHEDIVKTCFETNDFSTYNIHQVQEEDIFVDFSSIMHHPMPQFHGEDLEL